MSSEVFILVSKLEEGRQAGDPHFSTGLPVPIAQGRYVARVYKQGEGSVTGLRIVLEDVTPRAGQQALL